MKKNKPNKLIGIVVHMYIREILTQFEYVAVFFPLSVCVYVCITIPKVGMCVPSSCVPSDVEAILTMPSFEERSDDDNAKKLIKHEDIEVRMCVCMCHFLCKRATEL